MFTRKVHSKTEIKLLLNFQEICTFKFVKYVYLINGMILK